MVLFARPSGSAPGPITPPRRQRDAGWFRPPHHAHPSRVPLQSCAAPHALRRRADGARGFRVSHVRAPRVQVSALAQGVGGAPQGDARAGSMILARSCGARSTHDVAPCGAPSPLAFEGPLRDPMTRRQARPQQSRARKTRSQTNQLTHFVAGSLMRPNRSSQSQRGNTRCAHALPPLSPP